MVKNVTELPEVKKINGCHSARFGLQNFSKLTQELTCGQLHGVGF